MPLPKPLKDLLSLPTAPFCEHAVIDYVTRFCQRLEGVTIKPDAHGNLVARYARGGRKAPGLAFTAHMDHPGFVALEDSAGGQVRAEFRGGVRADYFPGARVRFWTPTGAVRGRVAHYEAPPPAKVRWPAKARGRKNPAKALLPIVTLRVRGDVPAGAVGMWDLTEPELKGDLVHARGCDDIAGCAAMLELLKRLSKKKPAAEVYCLFTRAEEVGFVGAIGACRSRSIPKKTPMIAIETSSELPTARIGDGPILRVGDRISIYDPPFTAFCQRVALDLSQRRKAFGYQRKLMDGGACEATAYCAYGYTATGVCIALGNYHNMNVKSGKIGAEYVSLSDWRGMVDWFEALAVAERPTGGEMPTLVRSLETRYEQFKERL